MRYYRQSKSLHNEYQLLLPLFCSLPEPVVELPQGWFDADLDRAYKESDAQTFAALANGAEILHEAVLYRSIEMIGFPGPLEDKREILNWIMEPDLEEIAGITVDNRRRAFSFHMCCKAAGVDPDAMREQIEAMLETLRRKIRAKQPVTH